MVLLTYLLMQFVFLELCLRSLHNAYYRVYLCLFSISAKLIEFCDATYCEFNVVGSRVEKIICEMIWSDLWLPDFAYPLCLVSP